jgi:hypothetical protein
MLNPPLTISGDPCRVEGEFFVMKRKGVEFEFKVDKGNKYSGKGFAVLTTCRLVVIQKDLTNPFKAFDIPLAFLRKEEFKQPIFGSNYISGVVSPLFNILPGDISFKIWFTEGGTGTFAPSFLNMVNSLRRNQNKGLDTKTMNIIATGQFSKIAYVDPNDPSVIFLEQPSVKLRLLF